MNSNTTNLASACNFIANRCESCRLTDIFFDMCHSIRRINDMAPFSIFNNYRDRTFEKDLDKWTLTRLAQDKFFTVMMRLKSTKMTPQGYSIEDFSKFMLDFLLTSVIMEFNFKAGMIASNTELLNTIGDAPRKMTIIFPGQTADQLQIKGSPNRMCI